VKWYSHRIITGVFTFTLTHDFIATIAAVLGSILPDKLEGKNHHKNFPLLNNTNEHRKFSHLLVVYVILVVGFFLLAYLMKKYLVLNFTNLFDKIIKHRFTSNNLYALILYFFSFFFFGALSHVIQDFFFGGVPILTPYQKVGLKLKTGGVVEHIVLLLCFLVFLFVIRNRGY